MAKAPATTKNAAATKTPTKRVAVQKAATKKSDRPAKMQQKLHRLRWLKTLRRTHLRRSLVKAPLLI